MLEKSLCRTGSAAGRKFPARLIRSKMPRALPPLMRKTVSFFYVISFNRVILCIVWRYSTKQDSFYRTPGKVRMGRVIRAFVQGWDVEVGGLLTLDGDEGNHLARVLRAEPGMEVELLDGKGSHFDAVCREVSKSGAVVEVRAVNQKNRPVPEFFMGIAWGKGRTLDELVRPLTELGVGGITPLLTERTEARFDPEKWHLRKKKWQKIAQEACKQSGHSWLPDFSDPVHIKDYFASAELKEPHWMGSLCRGHSPLVPGGQHRTCHLLIGPEGGWTHKEEEMAGQVGCQFFSLGVTTLRMETAAVSALAVARSHLLC